MDGAYCIDPHDLPDDEEEPDCKDLSPGDFSVVARGVNLSWVVGDWPLSGPEGLRRGFPGTETF